MKMKKSIKTKPIKELSKEEKNKLFELISLELGRINENISAKTGYYCQSHFSILADVFRNCLNIDVDISLLEKPHYPDESKITWYENFNPNNCTKEPILIFEKENYFKIFNGVHRTTIAERNGEKTIKANIIITPPEYKSCVKKKST